MARTIEPKFLAVAYEEGMISRLNALRIKRTRQTYCDSGVEAPPVGDIAIDLQILTKAQADTVFKRQQEYKQGAKQCRDPWRGDRLYERLRTLKTPSRVVAGVAIVAAIGGASYFGSRSAESAAIAASISAALVLAINLIWPNALQRPIILDRVALGLLIVAIPVCLVYAFVMANFLETAARVAVQYAAAPEGADSMPDPLEIGSLWRRFFWSESAVTAGILFLAAIAFWLHRGVRLQNARICRLTEVTTEAHRWLATLRNEPTREVALEAASRLLKNTAGLLRLNRWTRFLARVFFWNKSVEAVSLWYLEPDIDPNQGLNIVLFSFPTAPHEVQEACKIMQREYHPVHFDREGYAKVLRRCMKRRGLDRKQFLRDAERCDFISLAGYVYAKKEAFPSGDTERCLAFDPHYVDPLEEAGKLTRVLAKWLNFTSFCALPVFRLGDRNDDVIGVLQAYRNVRNGVTPEDVDALLTLSCHLGVILSIGASERPKRKEGPLDANGQIVRRERTVDEVGADLSEPRPGSGGEPTELPEQRPHSDLDAADASQPAS